MYFLLYFVLFITIFQIINGRIVFDLMENTTAPANYSEILKNIEKTKAQNNMINFRIQSVTEQYDSGEEQQIVIDNRNLFAVEEYRLATPPPRTGKICKKGFKLIRNKCRRIFA